MAQTADNSLERRLLDLEKRVEALSAAAAVGGTSVAAEVDAPYTLTGVTGTAGLVAWITNQGPTVDLLVTGGRLLVQFAAAFEVYGNKASLWVGYQVRGPVTADDEAEAAGLLGAAAIIRAPDIAKTASLQDDGTGMNQLGAFGSFDLVTGLEAGWYRVETAYQLGYSGTTGAPYGIADARRLAVTRY